MSEEEIVFRRCLQDAMEMRMPFGKYGPSGCPPSGLPLCDLPYEYLNWFQRKGFPKGRLGEVMSLVWQLKRDGAEDVFALLRGDRGPESHRRPRRRHWEF